MKDIKSIVNIVDVLVDEEISKDLLSEENYYTEFLNRYVKQRNS